MVNPVIRVLRVPLAMMDNQVKRDLKDQWDQSVQLERPAWMDHVDYLVYRDKRVCVETQDKMEPQDNLDNGVMMVIPVNPEYRE